MRKVIFSQKKYMFVSVKDIEALLLQLGGAGSKRQDFRGLAEET